ncbi:hypothetical protein [Ralstonia pseudosolanacearum]|uniref:hypothetical protein n=1 Tax=Ralstonia pseudosolanacearum TaxID=1310165 RepID=UPI002B3116AD|nr:hypothetical protein MAFF301524_32570 [Ralstonia pseudosolanacearum]
MTKQKQPSFLPEPEALHTRRRQQFLYEALYANVRARLVEGIESCSENVQKKKGHPDPGYVRDAQGGLYEETFWLWMLDYTSGKNLDELAAQFSRIVDEFVRWNELRKR